MPRQCAATGASVVGKSTASPRSHATNEASRSSEPVQRERCMALCRQTAATASVALKSASAVLQPRNSVLTSSARSKDAPRRMVPLNLASRSCAPLKLALARLMLAMRHAESSACSRCTRRGIGVRIPRVARVCQMARAASETPFEYGDSSSRERAVTVVVNVRSLPASMSARKSKVSREGNAMASVPGVMASAVRRSMINAARKYSCREVWANEKRSFSSRMMHVAVRRSFLSVSRFVVA